MAGFREFVTGEVLTAANVDDFLAKQAVMKFADAAARDSALGTAVAGGNALREGMVAWLDSDDSVIAYDGSAWSPIGAAGIGSNVVTGTTTTDTSTTSTSSQNTSLDATITPTSATSKVLIIVQVQNFQSNENSGISVLNVHRGDASGTLLAVESSRYFYEDGTGYRSDGAALVVVDSPATTSATTYTLTIRSTNSPNTAKVSGRQNMVLIEVAA
jgi:hypothetical protein